MELADPAGRLQLGRDRLSLGRDDRDRGPRPGRRKRLVERLADANVPLRQPAGRGPQHDLLHDRQVTLVDRPGRPAGVGRGRHQDHGPAVALRFHDGRIAVVERQRDLRLGPWGKQQLVILPGERLGQPRRDGSLGSP